MKIAIATEELNVSDHFEKCEKFTFVEIENSEVINKTVVDAAGYQHDQLSIFLLTQGAFVVISGGMDEILKKNLKSNGIQFITDAQGSVDEIILSYISGSLISKDVGCSSHNHDDM